MASVAWVSPGITQVLLTAFTTTTAALYAYRHPGATLAFPPNV